MKASELRINNYVKSGNIDCYINFFLGMDFVDLEVIGFEFTDDNHEEEIKNLEPIPITVEWLIKFGFDMRSTSIYTKDLNMDMMAISPVDGSFGLYNSIFDFNRGISYNRTYYIEYVHQLQNLYHSLTGKELKIKKGDR